MTQPTPLTGTATLIAIFFRTVVSFDATHTPHGDGNSSGMTLFSALYSGTQPTPLTGTATPDSRVMGMPSISDATHTPHGDGNFHNWSQA